MEFSTGIGPGDYYDSDQYSPNHIYENEHNSASRIIDAVNDMLADDKAGSQFSYQGKAELDDDILMCTRWYKTQEPDVADSYGYFPVFQQARVEYNRMFDGEKTYEEYDIITAVSVGGILNTALQNQYIMTTKTAPNGESAVTHAKVHYHDQVFENDQARPMTPYDGEQLMRFLNEMRAAYRYNNQETEERV